MMKLLSMNDQRLHAEAMVHALCFFPKEKKTVLSI